MLLRFTAIALLAGSASACSGGPAGNETPRAEGNPDGEAAASAPNVEGWKTDWSKRTIDLGELIRGIGASDPRDLIPPLDDPKFESVAQASEWLADREPVAMLELDGAVRAYPLRILTWHEIVNDEVAGTPVAVTYCPLCNSAVGFDRRVDGQTLRFGVSGTATS